MTTRDGWIVCDMDGSIVFETSSPVGLAQFVRGFGDAVVASRRSTIPATDAARMCLVAERRQRAGECVPGVLVEDRSGVIAAANGAALDLLDLSPDDLVGSGRDADWPTCRLDGGHMADYPSRQAIRTGKKSHERMSLSLRAETRWLDSAAEPVFQPGCRRPIGAIASIFRLA